LHILIFSVLESRQNKSLLYLNVTEAYEGGSLPHNQLQVNKMMVSMVCFTCDYDSENIIKIIMYMNSTYCCLVC